MRKLIGNLRLDIDETSLYDDANFPEGKGRRGPTHREQLFAAAAITAVGLFFVTGFFLIGSSVDWVLTETIATRRSRVWAWIPMVLFALGGCVITCGGLLMLWTTLRRRRRRPR